MREQRACLGRPLGWGFEPRMAHRVGALVAELLPRVQLDEEERPRVGRPRRGAREGAPQVGRLAHAREGALQPAPVEVVVDAHAVRLAVQVSAPERRQDEGAVGDLRDGEGGAQRVARVREPVVDDELLEDNEALRPSRLRLLRLLRLLVGRVGTPQPLLEQPVAQLRPGQPAGEDGHGPRGRRGALRHAVLEVLQPVGEERRGEDTPARAALARRGVARLGALRLGALRLGARAARELLRHDLALEIEMALEIHRPAAHARAVLGQAPPDAQVPRCHAWHRPVQAEAEAEAEAPRVSIAVRRVAARCGQLVTKRRLGHEGQVALCRGQPRGQWVSKPHHAHVGHPHLQPRVDQRGKVAPARRLHLSAAVQPLFRTRSAHGRGSWGIHPAYAHAVRGHAILHSESGGGLVEHHCQQAGQQPCRLDV